MKGKILIISLLSWACFACMSCGDDAAYDFYGDANNKVYIKTLENTVNGFDKVVMDVIKTPNDAFFDAFELPVYSMYNADENIDVSFSINLDLVSVYNAEHKTSYQEFPIKAIDLQNNNLTILSDKTMSEDKLKLNIHKEAIAELEAGEYLLPIIINNVTGNAVASSNRNKIYLIIKLIEDTDNIWDLEVNNGGSLLATDRTSWSVTTVNSKFKNDAISKLFDGNENSYEEYSISTLDDNTCFTVDMQKEYDNISGMYLHFYNSNYAIPSSDIYMSSDNENWEYQGRYDKNAETYKLYFYSVAKARYIKIVPLKSSRGKYIYLRELNVYIKD